MIRAVNLYGVRVGATTHRIWATSTCDAIARAHGMGLPASCAWRLP